MSRANLLALNYTKLLPNIEAVLRVNLCPYIEGSPGIGKSALARHIARTRNLLLIDLRLSQMEPTDLLGFPTVNQATGRSEYAPPAHFPLEGDPIPLNSQGVPYSGFLIFLDELSHADRATQKASYKLILDRLIGNKPLHSKAYLMAAGNKADDNAFAEPMSTALQSRLIHFELISDPIQWIDWAAETNIDTRITSFIKFKPNMHYTFNPDHTEKTYACPRTWQNLSNLIANQSKLGTDFKPLVAGTISESAGREFLAFCKQTEKAIAITDIVANPHSIQMPQDPAILYSLTSSIGSFIKESNAAALMQFVSRMGMEYQVLTMREVIRRDRNSRTLQPVKDWIKSTAVDLYG